MANRISDSGLFHRDELSHKLAFKWELEEEETCRPLRKDSSPQYHENWLAILPVAVAKLLSAVEERKDAHLRYTGIVAQMKALETRVETIQSAGSLVIPITTFAPDPFSLLKEIKAVVQQVDEDEFIASFFDANIQAAGCNQSDAIENLKDMITSRFDLLERIPAEKQGPGPARQMAVLRTFVSRE